MIIGSNEKAEARKDLYCSILDQMASKDKGFSTLLLKLKQGLQTLVITEQHQTTKSSDLQSTIVNNSTSSQTKKEMEGNNVIELQKKLAGYERVMKEMKKQIAAQKTEI